MAFQSKLVQSSDTSLVSEGLYRFSGLWGAAYAGSHKLMDVMDVSGSVDINQVPVPLLGQTRQGLKPGLETRSGTLTVQKIDTSWEMEVWQYLGTSADQRRQNRDSGQPNLRAFTLMIEYDDPDALGVEAWRLDGCLLWTLPLGFTYGDGLVDRQFTFTWEKETPVTAFFVDTSSGFPKAHYYDGFGRQ